MRSTIIAILIIFVFCLQINGQHMILPKEQIQKVSTEALKTFGSLVTKDNFKMMGFKSADKVKSAQLGDYLQVFMVRLDMLQKYQPNDDPDKMLQGGDRVIYPVMVDNRVQSSFTVHKVKEKWSATGFGNSNLIKLLDKGRKIESDSSKLSLSSYFVVKIPALNLFFIGFHAQDKLMLTPLFDDKSLGLKAYKSKAAEEVFEALIPVAKNHDGLPR